MTATVKKERRWLKSAIAASAEAQIALPWQRRHPPQARSDETARPRPRAQRRPLIAHQLICNGSQGQSCGPFCIQSGSPCTTIGAACRYC